MFKKNDHFIISVSTDTIFMVVLSGRNLSQILNNDS